MVCPFSMYIIKFLSMKNSFKGQRKGQLNINKNNSKPRSRELSRFLWWGMLVSNRRPLECESENIF